MWNARLAINFSAVLGVGTPLENIDKTAEKSKYINRLIITQITKMLDRPLGFLKTKPSAPTE